MTRLTLKSLLVVFAIVVMVGTVASAATATVFSPIGGKDKVLTFAREVDSPYVMPAGLYVEYKQGVIRAQDQNFILKITLVNGKFADGSAAPVLTYGGAVATDVTISPLTTGNLKDKTEFEWLVTVNVDLQTYPTFNISMAGTTLSASTIESGGTVNIQVTTREASTINALEPMVEDALATGDWAITAEIVADDATIDVATERTKFVAETGAGADTLTVDNGATIQVKVNAEYYDASGVLFASLAGGETVKVTFASNLTEISEILFAGQNKLDDTKRAAASYSVEKTLSALTSVTPVSFMIQGDGDTIATRTLTVALEVLDKDLNVDNAHVFQAAVKITQWKLNGTVLSAAWINGNNAALNGRVYLTNQTGITGGITVKAMTLPRVGTASADLGSVVVGNLPANGTAMIKIAEDVLAPLGITLPYVADGGNIALEITINVTDASGIFQTFGVSGGVITTVFGTCPLARIN